MRYLSLLLGCCFLLTLAPGATAQTIRKGRPAEKRQPEFSDPQRIAFTPFGFVIAYGEVNPAIGLSYEYIVNRQNGLSVYVPFVFGYSGPDQSTSFGYGSVVHTSFHAAPGVRFHTGGANSTRDFATGLGVLIGNMHFRPTADYNNYTPAPYNWGMAGLVCDNSFNATRGHFMFGFDARVGYLAERREGTQFFLVIGMHFGGKF